VTDHEHIYLVGEDDSACRICRERKSASELDAANAQALADHTIRAMRLMRDEIQKIEDEAADRMLYAEWKDGA
jgi:hypothetical protein